VLSATDMTMSTIAAICSSSLDRWHTLLVMLCRVWVFIIYIPHPPLSRKKDSKTALVTVAGGSLSSDQLVAQLQRVVSSKWNWQPVVHEQCWI
jgi:hypothetical protein